MTRDARLMALLQLEELAHQPKRGMDPFWADMPAAPVSAIVEAEAAVSEDGVLCACCQKSFPALKRHLLVEHGLDEPTYRGLYSIPLDQPLVSAGYQARKRAAIAAYRGEALIR